MRKIILIAILTSIFQLNLIADDEIGMTHEFGLQITGSYDYNEPEFMHNKSELQDHWLDNFGLVYNFKNSFVLNDFLTEFEFDSDFRRTTHDYWSDQSGTQKDIENDILNLRTLYGFQLNDNLVRLREVLSHPAEHAHRVLKDVAFPVLREVTPLQHHAGVSG